MGMQYPPRVHLYKLSTGQKQSLLATDQLNVVGTYLTTSFA